MRGWVCDVLDVLAPTDCAGCGRERWGREASAWCPECIDGLPRSLRSLVRCPKGVRRAWGYGPYEGPVGAGIRRGKYRPDPVSLRELGGWVAQAAAGSVWDVDAVVPVPQSHSAWRRRRFSPAEVLAREVGAALGLPVLKVLHREERRVQASLPLWARSRNVAKAFSARDVGDRRRLLLVDDVVTSGATSSDCARALAEAGSGSVDLLVAAYVNIT
jgi:predicted amidophosphoribosyltransferase